MLLDAGKDGEPASNVATAAAVCDESVSHRSEISSCWPNLVDFGIRRKLGPRMSEGALPPLSAGMRSKRLVSIGDCPCFAQADHFPTA